MHTVYLQRETNSINHIIKFTVHGIAGVLGKIISLKNIASFGGVDPARQSFGDTQKGSVCVTSWGVPFYFGKVSRLSQAPLIEKCISIICCARVKSTNYVHTIRSMTMHICVFAHERKQSMGANVTFYIYFIYRLNRET